MPIDRHSLISSIAFALRFKGKLWLRWHKHDDEGPDLVAKAVVDHLELSGVVLEREPPGPGHSTSQHLPRDRKAT